MLRWGIAFGSTKYEIHTALLIGVPHFNLFIGNTKCEFKTKRDEVGDTDAKLQPDGFYKNNINAEIATHELGRGDSFLRFSGIFSTCIL